MHHLSPGPYNYVAMGSHGFAVTSLDAVSWHEILAAAISLAATGAIMVLLRVSHPPAGATTLIVSLGILTRVEYLVIIEAAVILLTIQAWLINRLAGLDYPVWEFKKKMPPKANKLTGVAQPGADSIDRR